MEKIIVRRATNQEDMWKVFDVRWKGYKKYFDNKSEMIDAYDFEYNSTLLLAEDESGEAVGTMKILDRRCGRIELDDFVDIDSLVSSDGKSCVEATRFSIPMQKHSKLIKLLLWKTLVLYCQLNRINNLILSVRSEAVARDYTRLNFHNAGPLGVYTHEQLGNIEHQTYICDLMETQEVLKNNNPRMHDFFFIQDTSSIMTDGMLIEPRGKEFGFSASRQSVN